MVNDVGAKSLSMKVCAVAPVVAQEKILNVDNVTYTQQQEQQTQQQDQSVRPRGRDRIYSYLFSLFNSHSLYLSIYLSLSLSLTLIIPPPLFLMSHFDVNNGIALQNVA